MSECCKTGFKWEGKPVGKESKLANLNTYVTGSNKEAAVLIVHDVFGYTLNNARLLADHYAKEADVTVFLPDFFDGEVVAEDMLENPEKAKTFDIMAFVGRHSKEIRQPEIFAAAKAIKQEHGFKKLGAIGFCYGGWAIARLGGDANGLVDCVSTAHPSLLENAEIDALKVPIQIMVPEHDPYFAPELQAYVAKVIPTLNIDFDYQYFPGLAHGFATRGNMKDATQRKGLERAKNAAVFWFQQHLHPHSL